MSTKLSRRKFLQLTSMTAAGVLAACAPSTTPTAVDGNKTQANQEPEPNQVPANKGKKKFTFTMYGHPGIIEEMVPVFNETHPDLELVFERSEGQGYDEKLATAIASGSSWDCYRVSQVNAARFGIKGVIIDLKPMVDSDTTYPASGYLDGVLAVNEVKGKYYGIPGFASNWWMYFNKKLFDEAGIPYPTSQTTWDEYLEMTKALTKTDSDGNITQYGSAGFGTWAQWIAQHVWSSGGHWYYNDDLTAIKTDDPETIKALQDEADMMNKYKVHPSPLNPPTSPATILSGKVATELAGDWSPWDNHDAWKEEYDAVQFPLINGKRVNCYACDAMAVDANSKVPEAAYRWITWFACDKDACKIHGRVGFPVNKDAYTNPETMSGWLKSPRPPTQIKEALEHTKTSKFWRLEAHAPEFENTIYKPEIDKLYRSVESAEQVLKTITEKGNELMQKPIE